MTITLFFFIIRKTELVHVNFNSSYVDDEKDNDFVDCSGAKCLSGKRYVVKKYPRLILQTPQTDIMREDLFFLKDSERPFYHPDTLKLRVVANKKVSSCATETGLKEMKISLLDYPDLQYGKCSLLFCLF